MFLANRSVKLLSLRFFTDSTKKMRTKYVFLSGCYKATDTILDTIFLDIPMVHSNEVGVF